MAIKFDLFENPVKEGISSPKLHAKVITKDVVTTREIREAIHKKCTASPADVAAVITALNDELYEKLSDGYAVHLEGIGYFSLSLKCAPDINPRYIKDDDVQERVCWLVGHHHTYTNISGIDYQLLVEADFLVNIFEDGFSAEMIENVRNKIFRTQSGIQCLEDMYLKANRFYDIA